METKRVILATALSLAVLLAWSYFFPTQKQTSQKPQTATEQTEQRPVDGSAAIENAPASAAEEPAAELAPKTAFKPAQGRVITVETPLYLARLNTVGGLIESFTLKKYKRTIKANSPDIDIVSNAALIKAPGGLIYNGTPTWNKGRWSFDGEDLRLAGQEEGILTFVCEVGGIRIVRELSFAADTYLVRETARLQNVSSAQVRGRLAFTLASTGTSTRDDRYNQTRVAFLNQEGLDEESDKDDLAESGLSAADGLRWGGLETNYFLTALAPGFDGALFKARLENDIYRMAVEKDTVLVDPGMETPVAVSYYLGPKEKSALEGMPNGLSSAIDYGYLDIIAKPLMSLLNLFYTYVGNYGVAIILLTIVIKILFWPLSQKSYRSMDKMRRIQPMMAKIREKYKDDKQRMNQEMMQLYKTYKVNPAGGCLPMLLQIPVFIGLYEALLGAIELRHAPFITHLPFTDMIWLADLSTKDPYYITPLVMGATMFLQQKLTPSPGDPTQAKIMMFMPVIFTFIFLNFPAGLVIYWLVNNVLSIGQQWMVMRGSGKKSAPAK